MAVKGFLSFSIAAAAKAVAATVGEIGGVIAADGWVALVIIAVINMRLLHRII